MNSILSQEDIKQIFEKLVTNDVAQRTYIEKLSSSLKLALEDSSEDNAWYANAKVLIEPNTVIPESLIGSTEESYGELEIDELAKYFGEKPKVKSKEIELDFKKMNLEEIKEWERKQENSNDIYKIKARVANLARGTNMNLTPQGEQLVNTYVHVLKRLYDFAETIEHQTIKMNLLNLIRSQENMPGTLIAAAGAGVKP